jgi:hypothetical protein
MILYHYTNLAGLIGILNSKVLWLSHFKGMNDLAEGSYLSSFAKERVTEWLKNKGLGDIEVSRHLHTLDYITRRSDYYLCSFSGNGDLLDQWRCYGDNGKGVSIGLEMREPSDASLAPYQLAGEEVPIRLFKCVYSHEEMNGLIDRIHASDEGSGNEQLYYSLKWNDMVRIGLLCKHPAFVNEQESRLVFRPVRGRDQNGDVFYSGQLGKAMWRQCRYGAVPYFKYSIEIAQIKKIVIGPLLDAESLNMIERMAEDFGAKAEIVASSCPHR